MRNEALAKGLQRALREERLLRVEAVERQLPTKVDNRLGAAGGLWLHGALFPATNEAALVRADVPALVGVVAAGGVIAPVLMLFGLRRVPPG